MRISDWSSDVCSSDLPRGGSGRFLLFLFAVGLLARPHVRIDSGARHKLLMGAPFRHAPGVQHHDLIGVDHGGEAVRDDDGGTRAADIGKRRLDFRSEEHTSELQSLMRISYAVFCLKKTTD